MNHKTRAEQDEWQSKPETGVLELLGDVDSDSKDSRPEARAHVIDLSDIPSHADAEVKDDHAKVVEVEFPGVKAEEEDSGEGACAQDSAIFEKRIVDEVVGGEESFPGGEDKEEKNTNDNHRNECRAFVLGFAVCGEAKGK